MELLQSRHAATRKTILATLAAALAALMAAGCAPKIKKNLENALEGDREAAEWLLLYEIDGRNPQVERTEASSGLDGEAARLAPILMDYARTHSNRALRGAAVRHIAQLHRTEDLGFFIQILTIEKGEPIALDSGDPVTEALAAIREIKVPAKIEGLKGVLVGESQVDKICQYILAMGGIEGDAAHDVNLFLLGVLKGSDHTDVEAAVFRALSPDPAAVQPVLARIAKRLEKIIFEFEYGERHVEGHDLSARAASEYIVKLARAGLLKDEPLNSQFRKLWDSVYKLSEQQTVYTANLREVRRNLDEAATLLGFMAQ